MPQGNKLKAEDFYHIKFSSTFRMSFFAYFFKINLNRLKWQNFEYQIWRSIECIILYLKKKKYDNYLHFYYKTTLFLSEDFSSQFLLNFRVKIFPTNTRKGVCSPIRKKKSLFIYGWNNFFTSFLTFISVGFF